MGPFQKFWQQQIKIEWWKHKHPVEKSSVRLVLFQFIYIFFVFFVTRVY